MATKSIAFAFGRFNPPTIGHEKLMDMTRGANRNYRIYASQTQDAKRNPLTHTKKVKYMKDMFPVHKRKISRDKLTTAIDVLVKLYKEKYSDVVMIAGSDRVAEFDNLLKKYNGVKAKHGFYKFKSIRVISAGERDPDAEGLSGMSASKMRKAAQDNKLAVFKQGLPRKYKGGKELFKAVQKAMGTRTFEEFQIEAKKGPSEAEQDKDDFGMAEYPLQIHPDDDDGDWVTGDPTKPIEWKFKGDPVEKANKQVVKDRAVWHKDPKTADHWKESIDEGSLSNNGPSHGPGLQLKKKVKFYDTKLKKKDTGPTPADQLLPKNTARKIESKLPRNLQKLVHNPKSKSKAIKDVIDDMKLGHNEAYKQSDASKEFQAKMARRKAQVGRPKEPEKLSFFLKRARKAGYKVKKEDETYSQRISKPVAMGNSSGVGGTTVMPKMNDGATEIDEVIFNRRAYDAAAKWYTKFKKRGDKPGVALHKAAGMVRGVKDRALQTHLSKAKLL